MKIIKEVQLKDGTRAYLGTDDYSRWIFFDGENGKFDEFSGQSVPVDSFDYRYSHGGHLYQEACEKLVFAD